MPVKCKKSKCRFWSAERSCCSLVLASKQASVNSYCSKLLNEFLNNQLIANTFDNKDKKDTLFASFGIPPNSIFGKDYKITNTPATLKQIENYHLDWSNPSRSINWSDFINIMTGIASDVINDMQSLGGHLFELCPFGHCVECQEKGLHLVATLDKIPDAIFSGKQQLYVIPYNENREDYLKIYKYRGIASDDLDTKFSLANQFEDTYSSGTFGVYYKDSFLISIKNEDPLSDCLLYLTQSPSVELKKLVIREGLNFSNSSVWFIRHNCRLFAAFSEPGLEIYEYNFNTNDWQIVISLMGGEVAGIVTRSNDFLGDFIFLVNGSENSTLYDSSGSEICQFNGTGTLCANYVNGYYYVFGIDGIIDPEESGKWAYNGIGSNDCPILGEGNASKCYGVIHPQTKKLIAFHTGENITEVFEYDGESRSLITRIMNWGNEKCYKMTVNYTIDIDPKETDWINYYKEHIEEAYTDEKASVFFTNAKPDNSLGAVFCLKDYSEIESEYHFE